MISLKRYIDAHGEELIDATASAYQMALASAAISAQRAVRGVEYPIADNLSKLQDQLLADLTPATVFGIQQAVNLELSRWADSAEQHLRSKASEAREIMLVMASAAQSLGNRDKRYAQRFRDMTSRLNGIADLEDLSEVRRSLLASASELSADVLNMEAEGLRTISGLETKLEAYRKQLAEAERRECLDVLTGLLNRRGIESAMATRREAKVPFCVVMLDLNCFKEVNDRHGHPAGDDLLRQFSAELRAHCRPADVTGRWGGDEFIIVMNGDRGDAQDCADRVRKWAFGTYKIKTARRTCTVELSASIGIAIWDLEEDLAHLLLRADETMYEEKRGNKSHR